MWHSLRKVTSALGLWSSTSWRRPSWRLRSLSWLLGTPEATCCSAGEGASTADGRAHAAGQHADGGACSRLLMWRASAPLSEGARPLKGFVSNAAGPSECHSSCTSHAPDRGELSKRSAGNPRGSDCAPDPTPRPIRSFLRRQLNRKELRRMKVAQVAPLYESVPASPLRRDRADRGSSHRCVGRARP